MAILTGNRASRSSTTSYGQVRFATNAEALAGANVAAVITPDQLKSAVDAGVGSIIGGLTYKGVFDPNFGIPDLRGAKQGYFYKVGVSGTYLGVEMKAGDNMYVSRDMPENSVDPSYLDIIDNTESIIFLSDLTDVNATGAVAGEVLYRNATEWVNKRLTSADVDGVATAQSVTDEETAREQGDLNLQGQINTLTSNLASEISDRADGDLSLQGQINTLTSNLNTEIANRTQDFLDLSTEVDNVEGAVGLEDDGTLLPYSGTNFLDEETTLKSATIKLDEEVKRVEQLTSSGVLNLQAEVDNTQTSLGGLTLGGTFVSFENTTYLDSATSFRGADEALDVAIKAEVDERISEVTRVEGKFDGEVTRIDGVNLTQNSRLTSVEGRATTLETEATNAQGAVGLEADGTMTALREGGYIEGLTTLKGAVEKLDEEMGRVEQLTVGGLLDLQAEVDKTQASLGGLTLGGTFVSFQNTTYLDSTSSFREADEALDVAIKAEVDTRISEVSRVEGKFDGEVTRLDGVDTGLQGQINTINTTLVNLQDEIDLSQGITGAGLESDGSYVADATTTYLQSVTNLKGADKALDTELARVDEAVQGLLESVLVTSIEYVNDGFRDIQDGVDSAISQNTLVWVGPGSYGGDDLLLEDKVLIKVQGEGSGTGAVGVVELAGGRGLTITGATSTRNLIQGFQVEGLTSIIGTEGRHQFRNMQFVGGVTIDGTSNFISIRDCEISGALTISATTTAVIYLIDCAFSAGATLVNNATAQQVIVTQCSGVPLASIASITPYGTVGFSDLSARNFNTHITLPFALSFTGKVSQLTNDASYINASQAPVQSVNTLVGSVVLSANDLQGDHTATNYTPSTTKVDGHLSGIDTALSLKANTADLSDVATSGLASDVEVVATPVNYSALTADVEAHLIGIDSALASAGQVQSVNSVTPVAGNIALTSDELPVSEAFTLGYTGADGDSLSIHLTAIDSELQGAIKTLNGLTPTNKALTLDTGDILSDVGFSAGYTAGVGDTISDHLTAIDLAISLAGKVESVNGQTPDLAKNVTLDASHIDHASTITAWTPSDGTIKGALEGLDTKVASLADVAYSGDYADLINVPTAVINQAVIVTSAATNLQMLPGRHYIIAIADGDTLIAELPSSTRGYVRSNGDYIRITNWGNGTIRLREIDNESSILNGQTLINGNAQVAEVDIKSRGTIDIYGFDYSPLFPQAWGIYYNPSVEFNTKGATDGAIFKFNATTQKMELTPPLSDVAYDGLASSVEAVLTATEYTPTSTKVDGHLEGIDARLGELKLATNIGETLAVSNYTPTAQSVTGYLEGIDTKLGATASSQGAENQLQVGNGSGGLVAREWLVGTGNHLVPTTTNAYDAGATGAILRKVFTGTMALGTGEKVLSADGSSNLVWGTSVVKAAGSPLLDGVVTYTIGSTARTLSKNYAYMGKGNGAETWTLPATASLSSGVVVYVYLDEVCDGAVTLASDASNITLSSGSVSSFVMKGRGNQALLAWDGSAWQVRESKHTNVRGTIQYLQTESGNATLKVGFNHRSVSDTAVTYTLPARSTISTFDTIMVSRGVNNGVVTINPAVADAGANAILTAGGYASSLKLKARGDYVRFINDGSKWVTEQGRVERNAEVFSSSPAIISEANTFAVIATGTGTCEVVLPASSLLADGDEFVIYASGSQDVTISPDGVDSGSVFIYTGSVQNNSVTRTLASGGSVSLRWSESDTRFYMEASRGTASFYDVGTGANNIVQLDGSSRLPAVDGSQLTGIVTGTGRMGYTKVTSSGLATKLYHHSVDTTGGGVTLTLPALADVDEGDFLRVKLTTKGGSNTLSISPAVGDKIEKSTSSILMDVEGDFLELVADTTGGNWEIVG